MDIAESMAEHRALLTTIELERMNNILNGKKEFEGDPWRTEPVTLTLPSGRTETLSLISDPKRTVREKLHRATEDAEEGFVVDAAVDIYIALVQEHVFKDGNRRTAVLAAHYFLKRYGLPISGLAIHEIGLGDVRDPAEVQSLRETVHQMAKFVNKQKN